MMMGQENHMNYTVSDEWVRKSMSVILCQMGQDNRVMDTVTDESADACQCYVVRWFRTWL